MRRTCPRGTIPTVFSALRGEDGLPIYIMSMVVLYLFLLWSCLPVSGLLQPRVFQRPAGQFVLLYQNGHATELPDIETLHELGFHEGNFSRISNELYEVLNHMKPMQSLKPANAMVDELIRVPIGRISGLAPVPFWKEQYWLDGHYNGEGAYNPAILKTPMYKRENKVLMVWRSGDSDSVLEMGWFNMGDHSVTKDANMTVEPLKVGVDTSTMEDARLIEIDSSTVAVVFSGSFDRFNTLLPGHRGAMQLIAYGTFNNDTGRYDFADAQGVPTTRWLKYPENQKNWSPLLHKGEVLFVQSLDPMHVVRAVKTATSDSDKVLKVETVVKATDKANLPWDGSKYGGHFRGGTPVVSVRGKLLTFFHTETQLTRVNQLKSYFMGAALLCPQAPFNILAMSKHPILKPHLYDGKWANRYCNYVMFPMGVVVDDKEEFLYLSIGYQDRYGIVIKIDIDGLLDSMETVAGCGNGATASGSRLRH